MSVILDALKRVQDENRRRGGAPEVERVRPEESSSALMRRLSEPGEARRDSSRTKPKGGGLSPALLVALLVLCLASVVAGVLWIFQPSFTGPAADSAQPLLSNVSGSGPNAAARNARTYADPAPARGSFTESLGTPADFIADPGLATAPATNTGQWQPNGGGDLSDLSDGLGAATEPAAATNTGNSMLRLEVNEPSPSTGMASANGSGFVDLSSQANRGNSSRSATSGSGSSDGRSNESGSARIPSNLVDPGVKAAFDSGVRFHKSGDLSSAEDAYKRALKYDPHNAKVNLNLGVLYEELDRLNLAERHLRESIGVEPNSANAHNNLGVVLYRTGNYDSAMLEFERTLVLDPRRVDAYTNKGLIYIRWGQYEEAERAFVQVLTINPKNALAHYNLGMVYEEQELYDQAMRHYYDFIDYGGADYPEITAYLGSHLEWIEGLVGHGSTSPARR